MTKDVIKIYDDYFNEQSDKDVSLKEFIQEKVHHADKSNKSVSIETDFQLYLQKKKKQIPKEQDNSNYQLMWFKVGDLRYSVRVNSRWRIGKPNDRNKIYSLASEFDRRFLDAIFVYIIDKKPYIGEGQKRAIASILNYGPDYLIACLVDKTHENDSLNDIVVVKTNNLKFEKINNGRDKLDSFTHYFTNYIQGIPMAKAILETMKKTGYNFTPFANGDPEFNGLTAIEQIYQKGYSGDNSKVSLSDKRGPNILSVFSHHKTTYKNEKPHNSYIYIFVAFLHYFNSDELTVGRKQLNFIMENAKKMNLMDKKVKDKIVKVGIEKGSDFASKWGQGLKGRNGLTKGLELISIIWNKCYDNVPEGKKILQTRINENYFPALAAENQRVDYKYQDFVTKPIYPEKA